MSSGSDSSSANVALLDPAGESVHPEHAEPTGQLRGAQPSWQLEQSQWVAPHLSDYPIADSLIEHDPHRGVQQRSCVAFA